MTVLDLTQSSSDEWIWCSKCDHGGWADGDVFHCPVCGQVYNAEHLRTVNRDGWINLECGRAWSLA